MTTVQTVINNSRYDLQDFGSQKWDDVQLLSYLNRIVSIIDDTLIALDSDFTKTSDTVTLLTGSNTVALPTRCDSIVWVWDSTDLLLKEDLDKVMYRFQINNGTSTTGNPKYWAYNSSNLYFNISADDDYTLTVYFHQKTDALALTDNMPFNGVFDEFIRESIVSMAFRTKDKAIPAVDQQFYGTFKRIAERYVITRNMRHRTHYIDF